MFMQQQYSPSALHTAGFRPGMQAQNALRAAALYASQSVAQAHDFQSVNADVDGDGDEDTTGIRLQPIAGTSGQALAAGASVDLELKPLKLFKGLNVVASDSLAEATVFTSLMVGQTDMLTSKGSVPLAGLVGKASDNLLDMPWAGPGLSIYLTLKNISADPIVFYGAFRGLAVIG